MPEPTITPVSDERQGLMTDSATTCPECGTPAPDWNAEERECDTCVAIADLANARDQLAEAIEYEEWGAARNELEWLGQVIGRLHKALDVISDSDAHNRIVDLLNQASVQYNAAADQSNAAGGWR
ncbi:hypothetical protein Caci_2908 [Catenulispora acidiphila DSM 44928]|uniref:Uncharacterized protein n=1 Tax=Catenulispora acidiphila (strain DSM 44928 / JCM 14897 / NBRC 102108 / NRRL B-24433 / ID139908) TaxID=479433 RepID=C7Q2S5_CATAD|nr:hypothetical protein [Catenulispora acidiphila]ACU71817.1 hypothetical protein Caci_2908 [Catenulispora acidiphila DSM 44928]